MLCLLCLLCLMWRKDDKSVFEGKGVFGSESNLKIAGIVPDRSTYSTYIFGDDSFALYYSFLCM